MYHKLKVNVVRTQVNRYKIGDRQTALLLIKENRMNPVTSGAPQTYSANGTASSVMPITTDNAHDLPAKAEPNKVTLSE